MSASGFITPATKSFRRKAKKPAPLRKQVQTIKKQLAEQRPESKYEDTTPINGIVTTTASVVELSILTQGTSAITRIGDRVRLHSLFLRISLTVNAVATANFLRLILIRDKQPNGATMTAADYFEATPSYDGQVQNYNTQRFKILKDRTYALAAGSNSLMVDKWYKAINCIATYQGATALSITNELVLLAISDQAVNGPTVKITSRLRYSDA